MNLFQQNDPKYKLAKDGKMVLIANAKNYNNGGTLKIGTKHGTIRMYYYCVGLEKVSTKLLLGEAKEANTDIYALILRYLSQEAIAKTKSLRGKATQANAEALE